MYQTDILMQLVLQNAWQVPQPNRPQGQATPTDQSQGTKFQQLLEQRKDDLTKPANDRTQPEQVQKPEEETQADKQEDAQELLAAGLSAAVMGFAVSADSPDAGANTQVLAAIGQVEGPVAEVQPAYLEGVNSGVTPNAAMPLQAQPQEGQPASSQLPQEQQTDGLDAAQGTMPKAQQLATPTQAKEETGGEQEQSQPQSQASAAGNSSYAEEVSVDSWQTPLFREADHTPVRVGDPYVDMDASPRQVQNALGNVLKGAVESGDQTLEIHLTPVELGTVTVEFTRSAGGDLHIVLRAETEQTAKLLRDHAPALSLMLQDAGRGEVRIEVPQSRQDQSPWQQPDQQGGQPQQQQQQQQRAPRHETESFLQQLRLGLVEKEQQAV